MYVELHPVLADDSGAQRGADLISACVHCGFCLATCPTYIDGGDERDSPRGRIYLIKQLLETNTASSQTQTHLDRCLTCRSCETTCPSGVQYGQLLDIGKGLMASRVPRPVLDQLKHGVLRTVLSRPRLFTVLLRLGQWLRPILPPQLRRQIPVRQVAKLLPQQQHKRRMLLLDGCVTASATPNTNAAAQRVLDRLGITLRSNKRAGCCGAVNYHLGAHADGLNDMRRNIDAWWPEVEAGAEAIVSTASGCGAMLAQYGELLADDPDYADKAARIAHLYRDISEVLLAQDDLSALAVTADERSIAVHTPCTLQHALQLPDAVNTVLTRAGFNLLDSPDGHLCCGSAGTYSILQPAISTRLQARKVAALRRNNPDLIATANVGCQLHIGSGCNIPVQHWIELLDSEKI